jgi:putative glutamine amidotransferase
MKRSVIGITPEGRDLQGGYIAPLAYVAGVRRAGGTPLVILPHADDAAQQIARLDGLLLAGGGDVDPGLYQGADHPAIYEVDCERDLGEIALVRLAIAHRLPTLGICRGAQIINVALGGALIEHLPDETNGEISHRSDPPGPTHHLVCITPGSRLGAILQVEVAQVASWHHQAIRSVAHGLEVVACAPDGVVEAVELCSHPWLIAVQWHPELTAGHDPIQQRLFDALVQAAGWL